MRRTATMTVLGGVLTLGMACSGDATGTMAGDTLAADAKKGGNGGGGTTTPPPTGGGGSIGSLAIFPADNPWNTDISALDVDPSSTTLLDNCGGAGRRVHADFGTVWDGAPNGIPYVLVGGSQPKVPISFYYADESDPGPYPIPANAPIEGGPNGTGDRHVIVIDTTNKRLYETFDSRPLNGGASWTAGSGATWDLTSNALRPAGWTSADAAGLPIFPGLVRYDEVVERGEIRHALRFTVQRSQRAYIPPATHFASSSTDPARPPMGLRVRLKAGVNISGYTPNVQVILRAMKKYGMLVADNGSNWYVSGAPDSRWDDDELRQLRDIKGRDFEAVYTGELVTQ